MSGLGLKERQAIGRLLGPVGKLEGKLLSSPEHVGQLQTQNLGDRMEGHKHTNYTNYAVLVLQASQHWHLFISLDWTSYSSPLRRYSVNTMWAAVSHHASFIVANHGIVAPCQPLDLRHLKSYIQAIGQSICAWGGRTNQKVTFLQLPLKTPPCSMMRTYSKLWCGQTSRELFWPWGLTSYLQMCRLELPPLWRFQGGAASAWRHELFSSPEEELRTYLLILSRRIQRAMMP